MNKISNTIMFYNENAETYAAISNNADMHHAYERFLSLLNPGDSIADIGCGSGRDLKYFREHGYIAHGIDASGELCRLAESYSGCTVCNCSIADWQPQMKYNAFWASASLLHLRESEIITFFSEKTAFLESKGIIYFSMKEGIKEGLDEHARYFTPYSDKLLESILNIGTLELKDIWTDEDAIGRSGFRWKSIILSHS